MVFHYLRIRRTFSKWELAPQVGFAVISSRTLKSPVSVPIFVAAWLHEVVSFAGRRLCQGLVIDFRCLCGGGVVKQCVIS